MEKTIKEGQVYIYNTADYINPDTGKDINPRKEKVVIVSIKNDNVKIYNLNRGFFETYKLGLFQTYIRFKIYELTNERA